MRARSAVGAIHILKISLSRASGLSHSSHWGDLKIPYHYTKMRGSDRPQAAVANALNRQSQFTQILVYFFSGEVPYARFYKAKLQIKRLWTLFRVINP